jgi:FlaA1/EpsC-like NDP-sugar epimerase
MPCSPYFVSPRLICAHTACDTQFGRSASSRGRHTKSKARFSRLTAEGTRRTMASTATKPDQKPVLVTGAAGFIGFHVARALLTQGRAVVGLDNLNSYYDPKLKEARLAVLARLPGFTFEKLDLADRAGTKALFEAVRPELVIHLAAQAGVRYSLENPDAYVDANLVGFLNVLEGCRHAHVRHLTFASSPIRRCRSQCTTMSIIP